jgi:subtilase family serine protease
VCPTSPAAPILQPATRFTFTGKDVSIGGTSAVAPMWAGLIARLNQAVGGPVGFINPTLYRLLRSSVFTDITSGNNDVGKDNGGYSARAGWDCCTGLGTPLGTALLAALTSSKLSQFFSPNQITCGYSDSSPVFIDKADTVPVDIQLTNDNPELVTVLPGVTIPVGSTSETVTYSPVAGSGACLPEDRKVHAKDRARVLRRTSRSCRRGW